jgi:hypothetical protein
MTILMNISIQRSTSLQLGEDNKDLLSICPSLYPRYIMLYNHFLELVIILMCLLRTCVKGKTQNIQVMFSQKYGGLLT